MTLGGGHILARRLQRSASGLAYSFDWHNNSCAKQMDVACDAMAAPSLPHHRSVALQLRTDRGYIPPMASATDVRWQQPESHMGNDRAGGRCTVPSYSARHGGHAPFVMSSYGQTDDIPCCLYHLWRGHPVGVCLALWAGLRRGVPSGIIRLWRKSVGLQGWQLSTTRFHADASG
jgi:hypothetical protein